VGAALKRRRLELGLTQEDAADALGMVTRHYQKIESGKTNVTLRTLTRLALALRVEVRDLF
jgi:transcriptional regulator with XRE-family HTH domain